MKRSLFFIVFLFIPTLSGCWDRTELPDLAIITAVGIDRIEDGKTKISVQIFIPRTITSGETGEDPSLGSTFVREGIGDNLANAISKLQSHVPRRLFWGHCKVYIFGQRLAKTGIRKEIDYLTRHPGPRGNSFLYVSKTQANEMLKLIPPLERYSGKALKKLTQEEYGMITTLRDVNKGLKGEGQSVAMPFIKELISKEAARKVHETIPIIDGTAIFKKDKMIGTLNMAETRGLLWLRKDVKRSTVSVKPKGEDGEITMTPTLGSIKFIPKIKNNRWIMKLNISIEGNIVQNETHLNLLNENVLKNINKEYESVLKERVAQTTKRLQQEYQADVIDIGRRFHQRYPKQWLKVKANWDEKYPNVEIMINVRAKIKKPGNIGPPAALPREEVSK